MLSALLSDLGVVCPQCASLNAARAVQCSACQQPLDGRSATAPAPAPKPAARPVTVAPTSRPGPPAQVAGPPVLRPTPAAQPPPLRPATLAPPSTPPPVAAPAKAAPASSRFILNVVSGNGRGQRFRLLSAGCGVGRDQGAIQFKNDNTVSSRHAVLIIRQDRLYVRPAGSHCAVYLAITSEVSLDPGQSFAVAGRLLRYQGPLQPTPIRLGRTLRYGAPFPPQKSLHLVEEVLLGDRPGRAATSPGPLLTVGQSACDLTFPQEPGLAGRHCELALDSVGARLRDVSGGLGTFVRMGEGEHELTPGDRLRVGEQVIAIEASGG